MPGPAEDVLAGIVVIELIVVINLIELIELIVAGYRWRAQNRVIKR
jgi:hypothetical protein